MSNETTEHFLQLFNVIEFIDSRHIRYALPETFSIQVVEGDKISYVQLQTLWDTSTKAFVAQTLDGNKMNITLLNRYTDMPIPWSNKPIEEISQGNFSFRA